MSNLLTDNPLNPLTKYTKDFIISLKHNEIVKFLYDAPYISHVYHSNRHHNNHNNHNNHNKNVVNEKLIVGENAWSENINKNTDKYEEIKKKSIGLLNKLTIVNYDSISKQFMDSVSNYNFSIEVLNDFVPLIYDIMLKQLKYTNPFCDVIKLYNNNIFNKVLIDKCKKDFLILIGEVEDDRKITSTIESVEQIKKRYANNNLLFIVNLFNNKIIDEESLNFYIHKLIEKNNIECLCIFIKSILNIKTIKYYNEILDLLKKISVDKTKNAKLRFGCMDLIETLS